MFKIKYKPVTNRVQVQECIYESTYEKIRINLSPKAHSFDNGYHTETFHANVFIRV